MCLEIGFGRLKSMKGIVVREALLHRYRFTITTAQLKRGIGYKRAHHPRHLSRRLAAPTSLQRIMTNLLQTMKRLITFS